MAERAGDHAEARRLAHAALDAARAGGMAHSEALCLDLIGRLTGATDLIEEAERLLAGLDAQAAWRLPLVSP